MKDFFKMLLASFTGTVIFSLICFFATIFSVAGIIGLLEEEAGPIVPEQAVLTIDMSQITISEQTQEVDIFTLLQEENAPSPIGVLDFAAAINAARFDPAIKYIFLKPDYVTGGIAQVEEIRKALSDFRMSGKPVISYIENPTNDGYFLASVSDKIYMTPHRGITNTFNGMSAQLIFLKDALDRLGINVQLIRHGKFKSAGEMYVRSSSSKENLEQNEDMVQKLWESRSHEITASRDLTWKELDDMLDNLELNEPEDFLEKGLVDELLTIDQLHKKMAMLFMTDDYSKVESISIQDYAMVSTAGNPEGKNKIAVIYADGEIIDGYEVEGVAADRFVRIIQDIRKDNDVKAVVLRVNSPGGSVLASEKIKAQIDSLRTEVPVIASYGDYAASGGYWISANCDYIFANNSTLTGSIGVFSMIPDFKNTVSDKLHVNVTSVNSHKHADMLYMLRPLDKKETEQMQASVERVYDRFLEIVANGRLKTKEEVDNYAQGRVWSGSQAESFGLVDEIGTLEDALAYAAMLVDEGCGLDNIQVVEYPKPVTTADILASMITGEELIQIPEPLKSIYSAFKNWNASQSGKIYARLPYTLEIK